MNLRVADAISEVFGVFRRCNKYIDEDVYKRQSIQGADSAGQNLLPVFLTHSQREDIIIIKNKSS